VFGHSPELYALNISIANVSNSAGMSTKFFLWLTSLHSLITDGGQTMSMDRNILYYLNGRQDQSEETKEL
jgi:hypothetical protein